jgi:dCMP deaminase
MFFIHKLSCTIRKNGTVFIENENTNSNLYFVSQVINKIIKSRRKFNIEKNNGKSTHIVIDSLKNSLEITFFKERFSAFYMVASKDIIGNTEKRLEYRFKNKFITPDILNNLIELDEEEYKTKDFSKGKFTSPDIENCIQKSDYHIFNLRVNEIEDFFTNLSNGNALAEKEKFSNTFLTREEQLLKLIALINQPGLITPSASERNMQIAYTAKLNSGCISRQVGAVITDELFIAKSIGWNDVAKGHTPCNLRNVNDFFKEDLNENPHYSKFEKGLVSNTSDFKYKKGKINNFKSAIIDYFQEKLEVNENELNGKNCSFCFKTIHNYYEGVSNQVHTRSLHAEENAMLQLTKFGGFGVKNGYLFTTASPCELCSKKAYQLGIRIIFYIDPYPGIAINQIIDGGKTQPLLIPFYGAIGSSYHRLYEPYLSAKDEISMSLELKDKNININQFKNVLKSVYPKYNDEDLDKIKTIKDVQTIINQGLVKFENENIEDTDFNK